MAHRIIKATGCKTPFTRFRYEMNIRFERIPDWPSSTRYRHENDLNTVRNEYSTPPGLN